MDAWIDFNRNGIFDHPGEQIFAAVPLVAGPNPLIFPVPVGGFLGTTYARFRMSVSGGGLTHWRLPSW
ncbi:GEVED domain-containing protein [Chloroflexota bacterium]